MRQCYFDPTIWKKHRGKYQCVISDEAQLVYYHVPKSGSSTNRKAFRERFNGEDKSVRRMYFFQKEANIFSPNHAGFGANLPTYPLVFQGLKKLLQLTPLQNQPKN